MWMAGVESRVASATERRTSSGIMRRKTRSRRDLHATMLHQLGINHENFSYQYQGLDIA